MNIRRMQDVQDTKAEKLADKIYLMDVEAPRVARTVNRGSS